MGIFPKYTEFLSKPTILVVLSPEFNTLNEFISTPFKKYLPPLGIATEIFPWYLINSLFTYLSPFSYIS